MLGFCKECGSKVDQDSLMTEFSEIFNNIENGCETVSDLEESIYFNAYCTTCAKKFLIDTTSSKLYNDQ